MNEHDDRCAVPAIPAARRAPVPMARRAAGIRILPFAAYLLFVFIGDVLARLGVSAATLRWLYPARIAVAAALLALFWRRYHELAAVRLPGGVILAALAAGVAVFALWVGLDAGWMLIGTPGGFDPRDGGRIDWRLVAVRIAGAALVVPIMEELFWRSFLMRWVDAADFESVDPAQLTSKGFLITVFLFGFEHNQWLAGILAGVAYSLLYMRHRNLWSPILAHAVTNALLACWVVRTGQWWYW